MEHISGEVFSTVADLGTPLRWIGIASAAVDKIDYAASGGVANAEAVVKAILAGASAVEVCSAIYQNTNAFIGEATASSPHGWNAKASTALHSSKAS